MRFWRFLLASAALAASVLPVSATRAQDDALPVIPIGYLDLVEDPRYDDWGIHPVDIRSATAIVDRRPYAGAALGLEELKRFTRIAKARFSLERRSVAGSAAMVAAIREMMEAGTALFLLDATGAVVAEVAARTAGQGAFLFNTTATDDGLRNELCQPHLFHTAASRSMLTDALAQYLKSRRWNEVLVLRGPHPEDAATVRAFERSADLFGLDIEEIRGFVLGNDPRARERNDLDFLTGSADYEAVFVADVDGEFALGVPYATRLPAAVIGAAGLVPRVWHWSYLRHGAPQVHGRFERMHGRRMGEADWGAWIAMKIIGNGVARAKSTDPAALAAYLRTGALRIDGSKGPGMGFRTWNNQLRQPIMLTTPEWVVARAPIEGFRHRVTDLDTLGYELRDTTCEFRPG